MLVILSQREQTHVRPDNTETHTKSCIGTESPVCLDIFLCADYHHYHHSSSLSYLIC